MSTRTHVLVYSLFIAAFAYAAALADISWKPKVGDTAKYKLEVIPEAPFEIKITMDLATKVAKIEEGKITVESTTTNMKMTMNGQEQPMDQASGPQTQVFDARHETLSINVDQENMARMSDSLSFVFPDKPVSVGDSWKRVKKASKELKTMDSEATYTYDGDETIGKWKCYRIKFDYKETSGEHPLSNSGTDWISMDDGSIVKSVTKAMNFEYSPGMFGNSASTMTRIE